jgi:hypothetical protein
MSIEQTNSVQGQNPADAATSGGNLGEDSRNKTGLTSFAKPRSAAMAELQSQVDGPQPVDGNGMVLAEFVEERRIPDAWNEHPQDAGGRLAEPAGNCPRTQFDELQDATRRGSAITSLVLGGWTVVSALITPYAWLVGLLAVMAGLHGLASRRKRIALLGIVLATSGCFMSFSWGGGRDRQPGRSNRASNPLSEFELEIDEE